MVARLRSAGGRETIPDMAVAAGSTVAGGVSSGGGAVDSVNGVAPVGGDVTLTASDIPSSGPSDVQADLDSLKPITSAAELETRFPAVGGVHPVDEGVEFMLRTGSTEIDIGSNQIELLFPARAEGFGSKVPIKSTADGAVIFGEGSIDNLIIQNVAFTPNAKCISLGSATGKVIEVTNCALVGQDPGIIGTSVAAVIIRNCVVIPLADGASPLRFDGTISSLIIDKMSFAVIGPTGRTAIQILGTATISSVAMDRILMNSVNSADALFDIDVGVTLPANETIGTLACSVVGPGELFKTGSLGADSPLITSSDQRGEGRNSRWLGDVSFESTTAIVLTQTGAPTWDVMPSENVGPTNTLTANPLNQRFTLVIRALQDWGSEGIGRTDKKFGFVSWSATVARSGGGGARPFFGRIESRPDNVSAWTVVPETTGETEMAGSTGATVGKIAPFEWDKLTEFRLTTQGNAATATAITAYNMTPNAA